MPAENHSGRERGNEHRDVGQGVSQGLQTSAWERTLPKRDGGNPLNKIGQTNRSSGRKRHLKLLIEDNRDNDREEQM